MYEVLELALIRANFKASDIKAWLGTANLKHQASKILDGMPDIEAADALRWAFRFLHYNNGKGWQLDHSWRAAFDGFQQNCDYGTGAAEVPVKWVPHISGLDGWPEEESTFLNEY